jgi:tetratricopeptide (TPR) repeat protein
MEIGCRYMYVLTRLTSVSIHNHTDRLQQPRLTAMYHSPPQMSYHDVGIDSRSCPYSAVSELPVLARPYKDNLLTILCCLHSHDIPVTQLGFVNGAYQTSKALSSLQLCRILTPGSSECTFHMKPSIYSQIRAELSTMPQPYQQIQKALEVIQRILPADGDEPELRHISCSPKNHFLSVLEILTAIYQEYQLTKRDVISTLSITCRVSRLLVDIGSFADAKAVIDRILSWGKQIRSTSPIAFQRLRARLAVAERCAGYVDKAETVEREVIQAQRIFLGEENIETLHSFNNLGLTLQAKGRLGDAEVVHRRLLAIKQRILGLEHPDTLCSLNSLGLCLQAQGKHAAAEVFLRQALIGRQRQFDPHHQAVLRSLSNLAISLQLQHQYKESEAMHKACLAGREFVLGTHHLETLRSKNSLAIVLHYQDKQTEAEVLLRKVFYDLGTLFGLDHLETIKSCLNLVKLLRDQRRYTEAESTIAALLATVQRKFGEAHLQTLQVLQTQSILFHHQNKIPESLKLAIRIRDARLRNLGEEHDSTQFSIKHVQQLEGLEQAPPQPLDEVQEVRSPGNTIGEPSQASVANSS